MNKKQRITVLIDPNLVYESKVHALRQNIGLGELVAQALEQLLKNSTSVDK